MMINKNTKTNSRREPYFCGLFKHLTLRQLCTGQTNHSQNLCVGWKLMTIVFMIWRKLRR